MSDSASAWFSNGKAVFQLPMGFSLALVGAGYLIGIVGGLAMLFGTFLAWGVAVPYFTATGDMPTDASIVSYAMAEWKPKFALLVWVLSVLQPFGHY